jgi:tetratricopeptide (TPR) repeat protein
VIQIPQPLPSATRPEELLSASDRELGDNYLRLGDFQSAARVYQRHLSTFPGDAVAYRSLALALLSDRRVDEAGPVMLRAYAINPGLASRPIAPELLGDPNRVRLLTDDATRTADRAGTPAAWLSAAVLLQSQGKLDAARNALSRARSLGLELPVFEAFSGAVAG